MLAEQLVVLRHFRAVLDLRRPGLKRGHAISQPPNFLQQHVPLFGGPWCWARLGGRGRSRAGRNNRSGLAAVGFLSRSFVGCPGRSCNEDRRAGEQSLAHLSPPAAVCDPVFGPKMMPVTRGNSLSFLRKPLILDPKFLGLALRGNWRRVLGSWTFAMVLRPIPDGWHPPSCFRCCLHRWPAMSSGWSNSGGPRCARRKSSIVRKAISSAACLDCWRYCWRSASAWRSTAIEERRHLVVQEANAIGTAYLRTQMLDEPHRSRLSGCWSNYTDNRIDLAAAIAPAAGCRCSRATIRLLTDIWAAVSGVAGIRTARTA